MKVAIKSQQRLLADAGHYSGPIDGFWSQACEYAMRSFTSTQYASPARIRVAPFNTADTIPAAWRWVGSGVDLRLVRRDRPDTYYVKPDVVESQVFDTPAVEVHASVEDDLSAFEPIMLEQDTVVGAADAPQDTEVDVSEVTDVDVPEPAKNKPKKR